MYKKRMYRKYCRVLNGTENAACVSLSAATSSSFNWFPCSAFPDSPPRCLLVSELNGIWWTESHQEGKEDPVRVSALSLEKIQAVRLLKQMPDFCGIHAVVIGGNTTLYCTHPVCVSHMLACGRNGWVCSRVYIFCSPSTFHSKLPINSTVSHVKQCWEHLLRNHLH